jgi:hypothetical protein
VSFHNVPDIMTGICRVTCPVPCFSSAESAPVDAPVFILTAGAGEGGC